MYYAVRAKPIRARLPEFYRKLIDGTISKQEPDGQEIFMAMQRARVTATGEVRWSQRCFCPKPLKHERQTVYNRYFTGLRTEVAHGSVDFEGEPFMDFLAALVGGGQG